MKKSTNEFIFREDEYHEDGTHIFKLKMINIMFSLYEIVDFYNEKVPSLVDLKQIAYDYGQNYLVLMYKSASEKFEKTRRLKIFNITQRKIMINLTVSNQDFIGRFRSTLFNFVNGHFYFQNKVYKIRYDLLESSKILREINEAQLIDYYEDLLGVKPGEVINSMNPMFCIDYHKLSYFTSNRKMMMPMRIVMMPYMHERKIYLNKTKPGYKYFYTVIEEDYGDYSEGTLADAYKKHAGKIKLIVSLCPGLDCYFVYDINGLLLNKVSYKDQANLYGKPV